MRSRQRGAGLLIPVILVLTVAAFAVVVAASRSGGDVQANDANADAIQALYLAEAGLERQLKRFATGTACASLGDDPSTGGVEATHAVTDLSSLGMGVTGSITLVNGLATDFSGVTALPATQCRIPVTARIQASNVSRTIHAIVDNGVNLLGSGSNPELNNPTTSASAPSNWTLNPASSFAPSGGPDGTFPACTRSLWHVKRQAGAVAATAQLSVPVNFTYTGGSITTLSFHWRAVDRTGGGCVAGAASGPAWPGTCPAPGGNEAQTCFRFTGTATSTAFANLLDATVGVAVACPDVAGPSTFAACATSYQTPGGPAMPTKQTLAMTMAGAGTQTATSFLINIRLQQAGRREIFLDRIEATNPTALGVARVQVWRDCASAGNPATCL